MCKIAFIEANKFIVRSRIYFSLVERLKINFEKDSI